MIYLDIYIYMQTNQNSCFCKEACTKYMYIYICEVGSEL